MFEYPPLHAARPGTYAGGYNRIALRLQDLAGTAKKKRHDISIGIQSVLSTVYAVELVVYFIRLRHLANKNTAAWRTSLMLIPLVVDICLIWLTVRGKRSAVPPPRPMPRYNPGPFSSHAAQEHAYPAAVSNNHMPELPPYQVSLSGMDPHAHSAMDHDAIPPNPFASHSDARAHLNKPITE
ncbi:hypothetical protein GGF46_000275 [Coemansia sp. RSA 552]|nr:hypothetical protein GGF46_000275 [Coemansia sp. RSA 552]